MPIEGWRARDAAVASVAGAREWAPHDPIAQGVASLNSAPSQIPHTTDPADVLVIFAASYPLLRSRFRLA